ncbi:MAG TPA: Gfo/Idh/MocA family oxidoreductase [candidate division Zixibacteria bacterium]|nr:Gfo/Idh/MocA family oxidoreductase [candidate division Zixibacteria bacterium]
MGSVRWGLLSTARINRRVIPAIRASKRGVLTGVASRSQARVDAYASEWEVPSAFASYEAMLASDAVDAVYISLPNHLHAEWAIRAMKSGKHVLCEKPFAITLEEVDRMIRAAGDANRVLAEAFMYRHHPQTKIAGEWVRSGRLGDIAVINGAFYFKLEDRNDVRLVREWGGGSLWDVGVYPLSFAQFLMGEAPERVTGSQRLGPSGVDEVFSGLLQYSQGRTALISSALALPFHTSLEVTGTEGRLSLKRPFVGIGDKGELLFHPAKGETEVINVPERELYLGEIEDMHAAILDGEPNYVTLEESRNHVRTVLALYESARLGKSVIIEKI